jgi:23S rRNA pseudouridine1911/1915/1917 synthase
MNNNFKLEWEIDASVECQLIKDFLKEHHISKTALTDIKFRGGNILINEEKVNVRYRLKKGDKLKVIFPVEEPSEGIIGENIPLDILFEDEFLLVVNKPAGMSTIPSREHPNGSLANALLGYYEKISLTSTAHIVTRLDRDTSGLVLIAKHRHVHHLFSMMQKSGKIRRTYEALVAGTLDKDSGTIEQPIARRKESIIERQVHPDGQYACTMYKVLNRYTSFTHVELQLKTGRTHQIRVHLSFLGHPLLGDDLYGGPVDHINRQALHCSKVVFPHPFFEKEYIFQLPLAEDLKAILEY